MSNSIKNRSDWRWQKWLVSILLPLGLFAYFRDLPVKMAAYFFISLWAILAWLMETLPEAVVGLALPVLFLMAGVGTPQQIFSPWLGEVPWIILAGLVFGSAMMDSGLTKRIAYRMVLLMGPGYGNMMVGILLTGIILAPIVPSSMGKIAILSVLAVSLCHAMGYEPKSREATGLMLAAFFAVRHPSYGFLTGVAYIPMAMELTGEVAGVRMYWGQYFLHNFLPWTLFAVLSIGLILLVLRSDRPKPSLAEIHRQYEALGPVTMVERKLIAISILLLTLLATDFWHHIPVSQLFMVSVVLLFFPGIELMDGARLKTVNFSILFFMTGAASIGVAANVSGAAKWASGALAPMMQGSIPQILLMIFGAGMLGRFFTHTVGAIATFTGPLAMAAQAQGLNPFPVIYTFLFSMEHPLFPFQVTTFLYVYSFGFMSFRELLKVTVLKVFLAAVFLVAVAYPYWRYLLGIL